MHRVSSRSAARRTASIMVGVLIFLALGASSLALGPEYDTDEQDAATTQPTPYTIDDLAFMAGQWRGSVGEDTAEEHWTHPASGNLMGMFRWIAADGSINLLEMLSITEQDSTLYLRLIHYDTKLATAEDEPLTFKLASLKDRVVRFEPLNAGALEAITYDRSTPDKFGITVSFTADSGRAPIVCDLARLRPQRDARGSGIR